MEINKQLLSAVMLRAYDDIKRKPLASVTNSGQQRRAAINIERQREDALQFIMDESINFVYSSIGVDIKNVRHKVKKEYNEILHSSKES